MMSLLGRKKKSRKAKVLAAEFDLEERMSVRRSEGVGWAKMPRFLMPFLAMLRHKQLVGSVDCDRVYLELVSRDFGDGIIETGDADDHAFNAGYFGGRAARSWRERMDVLVNLRVVIAKRKNNRDFGFLLLRDPDFVVREVEQGPHAQNDEIPALIAGYWRTRSEVGGADHDANDLAAGQMATRLLKTTTTVVHGVDGRRLLLERADELLKAAASADDDQLFRVTVGCKVTFADDFMQQIGISAARWAAIKKEKNIGLSKTIKEAT